MSMLEIYMGKKIPEVRALAGVIADVIKRHDLDEHCAGMLLEAVGDELNGVEFDENGKVKKVEYGMQWQLVPGFSDSKRPLFSARLDNGSLTFWDEYVEGTVFVFDYLPLNWPAYTVSGFDDIGKAMVRAKQMVLIDGWDKLSMEFEDMPVLELPVGSQWAEVDDLLMDFGEHDAVEKAYMLKVGESVDINGETITRVG